MSVDLLHSLRNLSTKIRNTFRSHTSNFRPSAALAANPKEDHIMKKHNIGETKNDIPKEIAAKFSVCIRHT